MAGDVCQRFGVDPFEPAPRSKVGIALQTLALTPINGLRHPPEGETNGWYIWCGEYLEDEDFFQPLHIEHLSERLPHVLKYVSLPPGYRFLVDHSEYEDVWFDKSLLTVN